MIEPQVVDGAVNFPHCCARCRGTQGPFVDLMVDDPGSGLHLYLCKRVCARAVARVCGFSSGKKMDELANAGERVAEIEKDMAGLEATINKQLADAVQAEHTIQRLQSTIEEHRGRERQQEHLVGILAETARQIIEVRALQPA